MLAVQNCQVRLQHRGAAGVSPADRLGHDLPGEEIPHPPRPGQSEHARVQQISGSSRASCHRLYLLAFRSGQTVRLRSVPFVLLGIELLQNVVEGLAAAADRVDEPRGDHLPAVHQRVGHVLVRRVHVGMLQLRGNAVARNDQCGGESCVFPLVRRTEGERDLCFRTLAKGYQSVAWT